MSSYSRVEKRLKDDTNNKDDVKKKSKPMPSMPRPPSPQSTATSMKYVIFYICLLDNK